MDTLKHTLRRTQVYRFECGLCQFRWVCQEVPRHGLMITHCPNCCARGEIMEANGPITNETDFDDQQPPP